MICADCGRPCERQSARQEVCAACRAARKRVQNRANYERHKVAYRVRMRVSYHATPVAERRKRGTAQHDLRRYNLRPGEYDEILEAQGGVCALCGEPETVKRDGKTRRLSVDHDHSTGERRGLLCDRCNRQRVGRYEAAMRDTAVAEYLARYAS